MSNWSRTLIGVVLVGMSVGTTLSSAQLRDRSRLKTPLLRLNTLGQRQSQQHQQQPSPTLNNAAANASPNANGQPTPPLAQLPAANPTAGLATATPPLLNSRTALPGAISAALPNLGTPRPIKPQPPVAGPLSTATTQTMAGPPSIPSATPPTQPQERLNVALNSVPIALIPAETMDLALDDAELSLAHMQANVRDYTCDFIKRERVKGQLVPTETAFLKIRNRVVDKGRTVVPLGVYFKFRGPSNVKGREVVYVEGQNNDKLLCKEGGARGRFLPAVWLNQDSSFVMCTNRYPISEIGMSRLAQRLIENGRSSPVDDCKVKYIQGAKVDGRICSYLEVIRPTPRPGLPVGHNNVNVAQIFIDTELKMPIRFVAYDWPARPGGKARMIEQYTYRNIKVNVGLSESDFSSKNPDYNF